MAIRPFLGIFVSYESEDKFSCMLKLNPLYTDGLFHSYMLDESIFHFRGIGSILSLLFYFDGKSYKQTM